jgi:hypothetical protein
VGHGEVRLLDQPDVEVDIALYRVAHPAERPSRGTVLGPVLKQAAAAADLRDREG